jgi:glycosidase
MDKLKVCHNSHRDEYRDPFGAVPCGETLRLRLKLELNEDNSNNQVKCYLRLWEKNSHERLLPMGEIDCHEKSGPMTRFYEVQYRVPKEPGLVWYYFKIVIGERVFYYGNNEDLLGGEGALYEGEPPGYQITVYVPWHVPRWYREGIMYQIFVDRFHRGEDSLGESKGEKGSLYHLDWYDTPFYIREKDNSIRRWTFFGGNLRGIIKKLDYLKGLGVSIIYLNPIFKARSNHKYDTGDYMTIDPMFGNQQIFRELVLEAKNRGIHIILDGVFSHTGAYSIYFNKDGTYPGLGACQSKDSPYYSWYKFEDYPDKYESWWGIETMPNVDEMEPSYREFIYGGEKSVVRHWMRMGAKGWRLDVADELPDEFIKELRSAVKEVDDEGILLGEVWEDASNKVSYGQLREYLFGEELDSTTNYPLRRIWLDFILGRINADATHRRVMALYENYPRESFYSAMNLIGSHDSIRILTRLGEAPPEEGLEEGEREEYRLDRDARKLGIKRIRLITLMQFFFPGVPCIYYGDEAGLEGYSDPYNRGTYPWGREDTDILDWYVKITGFRQQYGVIRDGDFKSFYLGEDIYGFIRENSRDRIIVLINRSPHDWWEGEFIPRGIEVEDIPWGMEGAIDLINPDKMIEGRGGGLLRLEPLGAMALYMNK